MYGDFSSEATADFLFLETVFGYSSQYDWDNITLLCKWFHANNAKTEYPSLLTEEMKLIQYIG